MTKKDESLISIAQWIVDKQLSALEIKRSRIYSIASITLTILSILVGVTIIYFNQIDYKMSIFYLICIGFIFLIFSLISFLYGVKSSEFHIPKVLADDEFEKLKKLSEEVFFNQLLNKLKQTYNKNNLILSSKKWHKDKLGLSIYISIIFDTIAVGLMIIAGIIEILY